MSVRSANEKRLLIVVIRSRGTRIGSTSSLARSSSLSTLTELPPLAVLPSKVATVTPAGVSVAVSTPPPGSPAAAVPASAMSS